VGAGKMRRYLAGIAFEREVEKLDEVEEGKDIKKR